jgi:hypothetical protein
VPPLNRSGPVRDDLLDAKACIDWAEAQFSILAARIEAWQESSPYDVLAEFDPQRGMNALKFDVHHPLPRIVSAETGAIIRLICLRSALPGETATDVQEMCASRSQRAKKPSLLKTGA